LLVASLLVLSQLLLSITMLFTYPMPFFTCRELLLEWMVMREVGDDGERGGKGDIEGEEGIGLDDKLLMTSDASTDLSINSTDSRRKGARQRQNSVTAYLVPASLENGKAYQLKRFYHVALTLLVWGITLFIATAADR